MLTPVWLFWERKDLPVVSGGQQTKDCDVDVGCDELSRAVHHGEKSPALMWAPKSTRTSIRCIRSTRPNVDGSHGDGRATRKANHLRSLACDLWRKNSYAIRDNTRPRVRRKHARTLADANGVRCAV